MEDWVISLIVSWIPIFLWLLSVWWLIRTLKRCFITKDGRSIVGIIEEIGSGLKRPTSS